MLLHFTCNFEDIEIQVVTNIYFYLYLFHDENTSEMQQRYLKMISSEILKSMNKRKKYYQNHFAEFSSRTNSAGSNRTLQRRGTFSRYINCISPQKTNDLRLGESILRRYELFISFRTKSSCNGQLEIKISNVLEDIVTNFNFRLSNLLNP